jgi:hypothetical protein
MNKHFHECLCGAEFGCVINILPINGGRIRCEKIVESVCPGYAENMLEHASPEDLEAIASQQWAPLLAWRAKERLRNRMERGES